MNIESALPILSQKINDEVIPTIDLRSVHSWLGVKTQYSKWVQRRISDNEFMQGVDFISTLHKKEVENFNNLRPMSKEYHATLDMAISVVISVKNNPKTPEVIAYLTDKAGYLTVIREQERKEILFGHRLRTIFAGVYKGEIVSQYHVLDYRIDFYLPEHKLAIEFDEKHHCRQISDDKKRQQLIENELYCAFIRVKETGIDDGLNEILRFLLVSIK